MKDKKQKKGGIRVGAGRKPSGRQKEAVTLYVDVSLFGGKAGARMKLYELWDGAITDTGKNSFVPLDFKEADLKFALSKAKKAPQKPIIEELCNSVNLHKKAKDEAYDAPSLPKSVKDEYPKVGVVKPKTLDELKALCPFPEKTQERSDWIRTERPKYGI